LRIERQLLGGRSNDETSAAIRFDDDFKVECPTGSGYLTLGQVAAELSRRLSRIFLKDASGNRPVLRQYPQLQADPHYADCIPSYEFDVSLTI